MRVPIHERHTMTEEDMTDTTFMQRHWRKIVNACTLWFAACVAFLGVGIVEAYGFDFQPHEVADSPTIPFEIVIQSREATTNTCRYMLLEATRTACAHIHEGKCFVYVPMVTLRFSWRSQQTVLRHEYWHCNGGTHERRGNVIYPAQVSFDPRERIK